MEIGRVLLQLSDDRSVTLSDIRVKRNHRKHGFGTRLLSEGIGTCKVYADILSGKISAYDLSQDPQPPNFYRNQGFTVSEISANPLWKLSIKRLI